MTVYGKKKTWEHICGLRVIEGFGMAADEDKSNDFYAVLGLNKECTTEELRNEYKKLAMKWHPDRCSASGNPKSLEESKKKFQAIQQAYSVLSDANKRFLYDVGVYDCNDDDDENGMGDFLNEMAEMMCQNKSDENKHENESFEELQELFKEMFQSDIEAFGSCHSSDPSPCSSSSQASCSEMRGISNKRNSSEFNTCNLMTEATKFEGFCIGRSEKSGKHQTGESSRRKNNCRKQRFH